MNVTALLMKWREGDRAAPDSLIPLVYGELQRLARARLRGERHAASLQTTALVHEAYLRLVDIDRLAFENRARFFAVAARLMRQILVDHARRRRPDVEGGTAANREAEGRPSSGIGLLPSPSTLPSPFSLNAPSARADANPPISPLELNARPATIQLTIEPP